MTVRAANRAGEGKTMTTNIILAQETCEGPDCQGCPLCPEVPFGRPAADTVAEQEAWKRDRMKAGWKNWEGLDGLRRTCGSTGEVTVQTIDEAESRLALAEAGRRPPAA